MQHLMLVNPRRRKRRKKATTRKRRRNPVANPRRRKRRKTTARRRRRNPARMSMRSVQSDVMEAFQGATGALALDVTLGYLPLPANLKVGLVGTGVKALLAIGLGVVGQNLKIVKPATAKAFANGALTVVLHDELKKQFANFMPNVPLGEYLDYDNNLGWVSSGYNPNGQMYLPDLEGETMGFEETGLGEYLNSGNYMDDFEVG